MRGFFSKLRIMSNFYAVRKGRVTGVFSTWNECETQVKGFTGAVFKKFSSQLEALAFVNAVKATSSVSAILKRKRSSATSTSTSDTTLASTTYKTSEAKKAKIQEDFKENLPVVYTDGSCLSNGRGDAKAGLGVYWGPEHPDNLSEKLEGKKTNNRAEILAVCRALEQAKDKELKALEIRTDSMFLINCVEKWMKKWKSNGWMLSTGKAVINREELERLDACMQKIAVKFVHVKAHKGLHGNEEADRLANLGARM